MPTVITYSTVRNYSIKPASHPASTVQKVSAVSPSSISELAALFGKAVIAWVNGKTVTAAPCQPTIKKKRQRTQYVTLTTAGATRGFRPTPKMPTI